MCGLLDVLNRDGEIKYEECGKIVVAAKQNIFALYCNFCQDIFVHIQEFIRHVRRNHDDAFEFASNEDDNTEVYNIEELLDAKSLREFLTDERVVQRENQSYINSNTITIELNMDEENIDFEDEDALLEDIVKDRELVEFTYYNENNSNIKIIPKSDKNYESSNRIVENDSFSNEKYEEVNSNMESPNLLNIFHNLGFTLDDVDKSGTPLSHERTRDRSNMQESILECASDNLRDILEDSDLIKDVENIINKNNEIELQVNSSSDVCQTVNENSNIDLCFEALVSDDPIFKTTNNVDNEILNKKQFGLRTSSVAAINKNYRVTSQNAKVISNNISNNELHVQHSSPPLQITNISRNLETISIETSPCKSTYCKQNFTEESIKSKVLKWNTSTRYSHKHKSSLESEKLNLINPYKNRHRKTCVTKKNSREYLTPSNKNTLDSKNDILNRKNQVLQRMNQVRKRITKIIDQENTETKIIKTSPKKNKLQITNVTILPPLILKELNQSPLISNYDFEKPKICNGKKEKNTTLNQLDIDKTDLEDVSKSPIFNIPPNTEASKLELSESVIEFLKSDLTQSKLDIAQFDNILNTSNCHIPKEENGVIYQTDSPTNTRKSKKGIEHMNMKSSSKVPQENEMEENLTQGEIEQELKLLDKVGLNFLKMLPAEKLSLEEEEEVRSKAMKFAEILQYSEDVWRIRKATIDAEYRELCFQQMTEKVNSRFALEFTPTEIKRITNLITSWYFKQNSLKLIEKKPLSDEIECYMQIFSFLPKTARPVFSCEFCDQICRSEIMYLAHRCTHTGGSSYTCSYCGKGFKRPSAHKLHEQSHFEGKSDHVSTSGKPLPRRRRSAKVETCASPTKATAHIVTKCDEVLTCVKPLPRRKTIKAEIVPSPTFEKPLQRRKSIKVDISPSLSKSTAYIGKKRNEAFPSLTQPTRPTVIKNDEVSTCGKPLPRRKNAIVETSSTPTKLTMQIVKNSDEVSPYKRQLKRRKSIKLEISPKPTKSTTIVQKRDEVSTYMKPLQRRRSIKVETSKPTTHIVNKRDEVSTNAKPLTRTKSMKVETSQSPTKPTLKRLLSPEISSSEVPHKRKKSISLKKCDICKAAFENAEELYKHKISHLKRILKCDWCGKVLATNADLAKHVETFHQTPSKGSTVSNNKQRIGLRQKHM